MLSVVLGDDDSSVDDEDDNNDIDVGLLCSQPHGWFAKVLYIKPTRHVFFR